jgi:hypothetical protein
MKFKGRHYVMIALILTTAFLHLAAALDSRLFPDGPDPLFILNGAGYLGLLGAYFLPIGFFQRQHRLCWWALVVYVLLTILAWLIIWVGFNVLRDGKPFFDLDSLYGVPAKTAELILLYLLRRDKP